MGQGGASEVRLVVGEGEGARLQANPGWFARLDKLLLNKNSLLLNVQCFRNIIARIL